MTVGLGPGIDTELPLCYNRSKNWLGLDRRLPRSDQEIGDVFMTARNRGSALAPDAPLPRVDVERIPIPTRLAAAVNAAVARLFVPIDNSSIVTFRIAFGLIMLWEVQRYLGYGWVASEYIDATYIFPYHFFEWVKPWPGIGMYVHFYALGVLAVCIAVGFQYRIATILFWLGITHVFLLDKAHFLNHMYLVVLISFLLMFIPANRSFSIDAWRKPTLRSDTAPTWALFLLAAQVGIVYVYGGFAKLNGDWLRGEPMRMWLADEPGLPIVGRWVTDEWFVYLVSYAGLLLDLFIVPLLLWPRTRWFAVVALVLFHRFNAEMFSIGIFPTFATAAIILFLPPSLPRRVATWIRLQFKSQHRRTKALKRTAATEPASATGASIVAFSRRPLAQRAIIGFVVAYLAIQLLVPLRHHFYPGNPAWTDQGDRFAWRMMLHSKVGELTYEVTDPATGQTWQVDPETYISSFQLGNARSQPDMILQLGHFIADEWRKKGYENVEVRAQTAISLNGRDPYPIVDPSVDLAAENLTVGNSDWITSLEEQERLSAGRQAEDPGD